MTIQDLRRLSDRELVALQASTERHYEQGERGAAPLLRRIDRVLAERFA